MPFEYNCYGECVTVTRNGYAKVSNGYGVRTAEKNFQQAQSDWIQFC